MQDKTRELQTINEWLLKECGMQIKDAPEQELRAAKQALNEGLQFLAGKNTPAYNWRLMAAKAVDIYLEQKIPVVCADDMADFIQNLKKETLK